MKKLACVAAVLLGAMSPALFAQSSDSFKPLKAAEYIIFSGNSINEPEPPSKKDRKLTVVFQGKAAKEVFDEIGPDERDICSPDKGDRQRRKGGVECRYSAGDKAANGSYQCWVGMDLKTGKSEATVGC